MSKNKADTNKFFNVFRAGTYEQWDGEKFVKVTITPDDLQGVASVYNTSFHEAPLWIGHPKDASAPAYGWIDKLKAEGVNLYAAFNYVSDTLFEMINDKVYKKVSVELYNWMVEGKKALYLGAIGLTNMPLVKSLPALSFTDNIELKLAGEKVEGGIMVCSDINFDSKNFLNKTKNMELNENTKKFAASVGISVTEFDTEEKILDFAAECIKKLRKRFEDDPDAVKSLSMLISKYEEVLNTTAMLSERVVKLTDERNNLILDAAVNSGKIPPAKKTVYSDLLKGNFEAAKNLIEAMEPGKILDANITPGDDASKIKDLTDDKFKAEDGKDIKTYKEYLENVEKKGSKYAEQFTEDELKKFPDYGDFVMS